MNHFNDMVRYAKDSIETARSTPSQFPASRKFNLDWANEWLKRAKCYRETGQLDFSRQIQPPPISSYFR